MDFNESKTKANLLTAFAGESQARNKYTFFAQIAEQNGYTEISDIFKETADNEKAHARIWFDYLNGGNTPTTLDSLVEAAAGEHYEWTEMYKEFAEIAEAEGFKEIAAVMRMVGNIEKTHEERFERLRVDLAAGKVYTKDNEVVWKCTNCGHLHVGKTAPNMCPVCKKPQSIFVQENSIKN